MRESIQLPPTLCAQKRNGPAVHRKPCGACVFNEAAWKQVIANAQHNCDAYWGVWGLTGRQAIRKAGIVSDRHCLWLCSPIRTHKLEGSGVSHANAHPPPTVVNLFSGSFWMGVSRSHPLSIKRHRHVVGSAEGEIPTFPQECIAQLYKKRRQTQW